MAISIENIELSICFQKLALFLGVFKGLKHLGIFLTKNHPFSMLG